MTDEANMGGDGKPATVRMYTTRWCPYCIRARELLTRKGVSFDDIGVDGNPGLRSEMTRLSGGRTVPQIFIDGEPIGGYDELAALERSGRLDALLAGNADPNANETKDSSYGRQRSS